MAKQTKAKYLGHSNAFEYWEWQGEVYRNGLGNRGYMNNNGLPSNVRWESSIAHFNHYKSIFNIVSTRQPNPESRFKKLSKQLAKQGAYSPGGLARYIGERKYGVEGFAALQRRGVRQAKMARGNPTPNEYGIYVLYTANGSKILVIPSKKKPGKWEITSAGVTQYIRPTLKGAFGIARQMGAKIDNPDTMESAESLSKEFHGREPLETEEIQEAYKYPTSLTKLGKLTQIEVTEDGEYVTPIDFGKPLPDLCCSPDAKQMYVIGGNQFLSDEDLEEFGVEDCSKQYLELGLMYTLSYITDKHHLSDSDGKSSEYIHQLGEESGDMPMVVYDSLNKKLMFVGGSYKVEDRGIVD